MRGAGASFSALVLLASICAACAKEEPRSLTVKEKRQAALNRIADECGIPRTSFELVDESELHFKPSMDEAYDDVDCALRKINESKIPFKLGFVGNEAYVRNSQ